jgi:hypothetical protein
MKAVFYCLLACLVFSCRKDANIDFGNYIEMDGVHYLKRPGSDGKYDCSLFPPYYSVVTWGEGNEHSGVEVTVGNTCDNNRGALSNFRGFVAVSFRNRQDKI